MFDLLVSTQIYLSLKTGFTLNVMDIAGLLFDFKSYVIY